MIQEDWYFGTLGYEVYFRQKKPTFTKAKAKEAINAGKTIVKYAKEFAEAKKPKKFPKDGVSMKEYDNIASELLDPTPLPLDSLGFELPEELEDGFMVMRNDVYSYMSSQLPTQPVSGGLFALPLPPPDSDKYRFMWQMQVLDNVEYALQMMNTGAFTMVENLILRTLFPDIHVGMVTAYLEALIDHAVESKSMDVPSWKLNSLSALTGAQIMSYQDIMTYQSGYQEQTAGQPANRGTLKIASANATDTQKIQSQELSKG